jgi:hypothetical protein
MMAAGMDSAAAIGQKGLNPPSLPLGYPFHSSANTGAAHVADRRLATISVTTIFFIYPPFGIFFLSVKTHETLPR